MLAAFFVSGSLLTPGGGRRRPVQVLANGGPAALAALLAQVHAAFGAAFVGAVAAAAADTWSTEIGARSAAAPVLVTTLRTVERGVSGGVTTLGSAAGGAGAATIAVTAALAGVADWRDVPWLVAAGVAGGLLDSLLGATVQARWRCSCGALLETRTHDCAGTPALASGSRWITNDTVNLLATLTGGVVALFAAGG